MGVLTVQTEWALGGVQSFRTTSTAPQFHHVQQAIPRCKADSMLIGLVGALSLPTESVVIIIIIIIINTSLCGVFTKLNAPKVLLLQCPCACQSRFLQDDGDISIQSLELIVYDSPFPGVIDVLKIFREARRQSPDVPTSQFKSWSLL